MLNKKKTTFNGKTSKQTMHYIKQFKTKWMIPKTQTKQAVLHTSYNPNEAENSFAEVCTDFLSCRSFNP